jgi:hypothetical protein
MPLFKQLRAPERLYGLAMWVVSLVFAGFLIGLGGRLVADLPGGPPPVTLDDFVPDGLVAATTRTTDSLWRLAGRVESARDSAALVRDAAQNALAAAQTAYEAWLRTRRTITDSARDPEVLARTRTIDSIAAEIGATGRVVDSLESLRFALLSERDRADEALNDARRDAEAAYEKARFAQELRVFGVRLALTLPLLAIAWWLVQRKRRSQYWPLARGFVLFALFAFFVELVPYLPSYGGYVRYGVGVLLSGAVGVSVIRGMQRYLARRQAEAARTEPERRRALGHEEALRRMGAALCPGCERPIAKDAGAPTNFCVHCGLRLYDTCGGCGLRKNAFFPFCPACGTNAETPPPAAASGGAGGVPAAPSAAGGTA